LVALMAEERSRCDELLAGVVALGQQAVAGEDGGEVFLEGAGKLFERAAPDQLEAVRNLFAAFADKATLLALLTQFFSEKGPRVALGSELPLRSRGDVGLIVTGFRCCSGERGLVGVIGLKRMDYPRIIPIVDYVGSLLSEVGGAAGGAG
jgi:heat-inducible transcriptional repressor